MSVTRNILEEISEEFGVEWNDESMIEILCDYIDNQDSPEAFEEYVRNRAEEENQESQ